MKQDQLSAYLKGTCHGRQRSMQGAELEEALNISESDLHKLVNRLRLSEVPIASGQNGYFYAQNAWEIHATILRLRGMIRTMEATIEGLESAMKNFQEVPADDGGGE